MTFQRPLGNDASIRANYRCPKCRLYIRINDAKCKHCETIISDEMRDEMRKEFDKDWKVYRWLIGIGAAFTFFVFYLSLK